MDQKETKQHKETQGKYKNTRQQWSLTLFYKETHRDFISNVSAKNNTRISNLTYCKWQIKLLISKNKKKSEE